MFHYMVNLANYNAGRMNFLELLDGAEYVAQQGDPPIAGLDYDSRRVKPGWCFVAMRGETTDGNQHIDAALQAGAAAIVSDSLPPRPVWPGRRWCMDAVRWRRLSANFYGRPAERLFITGITGTNGKTTTFSVECHAAQGRPQDRAGGYGGISHRGGNAILLRTPLPRRWS